MLTVAKVCLVLCSSMWIMAHVFESAYWHIPISKHYCRSLSVLVENEVLQFLVILFATNIATKVFFLKMARPMAQSLPRLGTEVQLCLESWLVCTSQPTDIVCWTLGTGASKMLPHRISVDSTGVRAHTYRVYKVAGYGVGFSAHVILSNRCQAQAKLCCVLFPRMYSARVGESCGLIQCFISNIVPLVCLLRWWLTLEKNRCVLFLP